MDTPADVKQACIDLSTAAIVLFDLIDADGVDAPMDDFVGIAKLVSVVNRAEEIRAYYAVRNVQRILGLGVSPEALLVALNGREMGDEQ